jgi:hypothetical protein
MNRASNQLSELGEQWRTARLLYPLYAALSREFVLETPACADLETGVDAPTQESIRQAQAWFETMDERIQVHQLRQFLQTSSLADIDRLRTMLLRFLRKQKHTAADRDKIDFLLVQFFSLSAPIHLNDAECDLDCLAQILEPVLGRVEPKVPDWLKTLDEVIAAANACHRLSELFSARLLEQGRKLKVQCGEKYFEPSAMLAFARFNFLVRRVFFRLMHDDLNAILDGLRELESRGVATLDCRRAHFSHQEPTDRLRMICHSWKVMFHAEYSSGQPLKMLADLRTVVEEALGRSGTRAAASAADPPIGTVTKAKAAAAAGASKSATGAVLGSPSPGQLAPGASEPPEFDISGHSGHDEGDVL